MNNDSLTGFSGFLVNSVGNNGWNIDSGAVRRTYRSGTFIKFTD